MPSIDNVYDVTPRIQYVASPGQTAFDYPFPIFEDVDLAVDVDGVTQALTTDYTVSGEGNETGGTVTFLSAMAGNEIVTIYRDIPIDRLSDFQQNGPYSSVALNDELDRMTLVMQDLKSNQERSLRFPVTSEATASETQFNPIANWLDKFIYINASGIPEPAGAVATSALTRSTIGAAFYPQTETEASNAITPTNYYYEPGNVLRYGTNGVPGTTDMTGAFQNAINACPDGGVVTIPNGTYLLASPTSAELLLITKRITIIGEGHGSLLLVGSGVGASVDVIHFKPPSASAVQGFVLENFYIKPQSGTPARYGISIDGTNGPLSHFSMRNVRIDTLGNYAFSVINSSGLTTGSPFITTIQDCILQGGINLDYAGDSVVIGPNTNVTGPRDIYVNLVTGGNDGGAHGFKCDGNNITCNGGVVVVNAWQGSLSFNNIEQIAANTGANNALIDVRGSVSSSTEAFRIVGNYIGANSTYVADAIRVGYAKNTVIAQNLAVRGSGVTYRLTANADRTLILNDRQLPYGEAITTWLADSGTNTVVDYMNSSTGARLFSAFGVTSSGGTVGFYATSSQVKVISSGAIGFASGDPSATGLDTALTRSAAGTALLGNGNGGDLSGILGLTETRYGTTSGPRIRSGSGSPESAVTAPVGSIFLRTDGGAATSIYVKESGTGNTGWVAK